MIAAPARGGSSTARASLVPVAIGVDHRAPIAVRERFAATAHMLIEEMARQVDEAVLLSTCNRTELYFAGGSAPGTPEGDRLWRREGPDAAAHLFAVAAGLDSQLLGETEILSQVRAAAMTAQATGPVLGALFRHALVVGKRARAGTDISRGAASIGSAAAAIVKSELPVSGRRHAVIVGAGAAAARIHAHLRPLGFERVDVVNRTLDRAVRLVGAAHAFALTALPDLLGQADVVLCATSAREAVVSIRDGAMAVRARNGRRLLLLDLAVPRDVEPAVADLAGVDLYDLDAVQARATADVERRVAAMGQVRDLIRAEVAAFERWQTARRATPAIGRLRAAAESQRRHRYAEDDRGSRSTMRRLLHAPTVALRRGLEPDLSALTAAGFLP